MMSFTSAHFDTPEFKALSANGQAYMRAMANVTQVAIDEGLDMAASGEPGPEWDTPKLKESLALVDTAREAMTEEEGLEMSKYAHRIDYPEMYEKESP
jgi:hypothetical protein